MNIRVIAVGKLKEKYLTEAVKEYLKRLGGYAQVEVVEVPDEKAPEKASPAEEDQVRRKEAEGIGRHLRPGAFVVALAIEGKMLSSEELAGFVEDLGVKGRSNVVFIIGGSLGLHESILQKADLKLSFSRMTFPHQLMRVILLEQLYRAFKINRGEPYHK
ncbi:MAG: 23S rRNA (pseudouridine(1915)-N(3))-methyltransferase RlmH [Clostridia bacterium]|nr:23S rRNA (pseudouridine(1915)-N(3))-methyltransferase RlmH [Clostridia bacterium]